MATIYSLRPSILQLSQEDLYSLVHSIRESRRRRREDIPRPKVIRASKAPVRSPKLSKGALESMASSLTPAQKAALAASLLNLNS